MHELSIARAVVAIAERQARGRRVTAVELSVGRLRQVVPSALERAWDLVAEGTVAAGSELRVAVVPVRVECRRCAAESLLDDFPLACQGCGSVDVDVVGGEELQVEALELEVDEDVSVAAVGED